jgi:hypothetical protein
MARRRCARGLHGRGYGRGLHGRGFISNIGKKVLKAALPKIIDAGGSFAKSKIDGLGVRRRRHATHRRHTVRRSRGLRGDGILDILGSIF